MTEPVSQVDGTATTATTAPVEPVDQKLSYEQLESELAKTRKEAASRRVASKSQEAELAEFQKWKDAQSTELEKAQKKAADLETQIARHERARLQSTVAAKIGLDPELASRIHGDSEQEMTEDAKALLAKTKGGSTSASGMLAGSRGKPVGTGQAETPNEWFNRLLKS